MIDTRYGPQPEEIVVPLYPSIDGKIPASVALQNDNPQRSLASSFNVRAEQLALGSCASSLIRVYLANEGSSKTRERVGVPIFSCQSLVDAVIDSGSVPVFYDIEDDASISQRSIDFVISQSCDVCIWPVYFGSRQRSSILVDQLHNAGIGILFDEAQANPLSNEAKYTREQLTEFDAAVYSFGKSKLVAGSGGGAIYSLSSNKALPKMREVIADEEAQLTESRQDTEDKSAASSAVYESQDVLLENRLRVSNPRVGIDQTAYRTALRQFDRYLKSQSQHNELYTYLRNNIAEHLGARALDLLADVQGAPSIFAVKVEPYARFSFMSRLALEQIQTTWYYYPINRISRYRSYPSQEDIGSTAIAGSIVILPFQWTHSSDQVQKLVSALSSPGADNAC